PGAVERQGSVEHGRVHAADRGEKGEMRTVKPFLSGDLEEPGRARVALLVHVMTQARDAKSGGAGVSQGFKGECVPAVVVGRQWAGLGGDDLVQEVSAVLGDAEEARAATEQPGGECALD